MSLWREYDRQDSLGFDALRARKVDMVKSSLSAILAEGANGRFLNELKP